LGGHGVTVTDLRVRDLGTTASIELDAEALAALALDVLRRDEALTLVTQCGFPAAVVDPRGFRSGSMNERLPDPARYR